MNSLTCLCKSKWPSPNLPSPISSPIHIENTEITRDSFHLHIFCSYLQYRYISGRWVQIHYRYSTDTLVGGESKVLIFVWPVSTRQMKQEPRIRQALPCLYVVPACLIFSVFSSNTEIEMKLLKGNSIYALEMERAFAHLLFSLHIMDLNFCTA